MVTLLESGDAHDAIHELTSCLNTDTLLDLARRFSETYTHLAKTSTEHFLVTPVTALPNGREQGKFLAIDVGGSNLRVGFVELAGESATVEHGDHSTENDVSTRIKRKHDKSWPIGDHLKTDRPEDLFRWIGDCMAEVVTEAVEDTPSLRDDDILLGVTFSFPMAQTSLSKATLLPMGKGFAITTDLNLGEMLLTGYAHHCTCSATHDSSEHLSPVTQNGKLLPKIRVAAITNDTVATFASSAYAARVKPNSRVAMGLIVGTGTNATVPMRPNNLHPSKLNDIQDLEAVNSIVINTEWTIRGTDKPLEALGIKTSWDRFLDRNSDAPGFQPFEYMTSGRYLGEIVRLAFIEIICRDFDILSIPDTLRVRNSIPTRFLSEFIARADEASIQTKLVERFPPNEPEDDEFWTSSRVHLLHDLARAVQQRSSALIAAASVGLLDCAQDICLTVQSPAQGNAGDQASDGALYVEELVIAYTGSTIAQYPHWLDDCQKWIDELVAAPGMNIGKRVVLREALDGGIVGAGVLAAMGDRIA